MFFNYLLLVITALCWGITNVFIKSGSKGVNLTTTTGDNKFTQILNEFKYLLQNWKVINLFINSFLLLVIVF